MEIANVRLRLTKVGSDVPLFNVTPAEAMLLHILHGPANGGLSFGDEFKHIDVIGTAMVDTGKTKTIVDVPEVKAVVAKAAVGEPGKPNYQPAVAAVEGKPAVTHEEKVLRPRTDAEELRRLATKYSQARGTKNEPVINTIWPDKLNPKLPATFAEVQWAEVGSLGVETVALNYATGAPAASSPKL